MTSDSQPFFGAPALSSAKNPQSYEQEISRLLPIVHTEPFNQSAWFWLGVNYFHLDRITQAEDCLTRALTINPKHFDTYYYLGLTYYKINHIERACFYWKQALKINPEHERSSELESLIARFEMAFEKYTETTPRLPYSILVTGMGPIGPRLLFESLKKVFGQSRPSLHYFVPRLEDYNYYKTGSVYTSHALPPLYFNSPMKAIYVYGDPREIAYSTHASLGDAFWFHCQSNEVHKRQQFYQFDSLSLEKHFESWHQDQSFPLLTIQQDQIIDHIQEIESFVEWPLIKRFDTQQLTKREMHQWKKHPQAASIELTYQQLFENVQLAPNCKTWRVLAAKKSQNE